MQASETLSGRHKRYVKPREVLLAAALESVTGCQHIERHNCRHNQGKRKERHGARKQQIYQFKTHDDNKTLTLPRTFSSREAAKSCCCLLIFTVYKSCLALWSGILKSLKSLEAINVNLKGEERPQGSHKKWTARSLKKELEVLCRVPSLLWAAVQSRGRGDSRGEATLHWSVVTKPPAWTPVQRLPCPEDTLTHPCRSTPSHTPTTAQLRLSSKRQSLVKILFKFRGSFICVGSQETPVVKQYKWDPKKKKRGIWRVFFLHVQSLGMFTIRNIIEFGPCLIWLRLRAAGKTNRLFDRCGIFF